MCASTNATTSTSDGTNVACYDPTLEEAVRFDPTSVGLPEDWSLTEFSTLKG